MFDKKNLPFIWPVFFVIEFVSSFLNQLFIVTSVEVVKKTIYWNLITTTIVTY